MKMRYQYLQPGVYFCSKRRFENGGVGGGAVRNLLSDVSARDLPELK